MWNPMRRTNHAMMLYLESATSPTKAQSPSPLASGRSTRWSCLIFLKRTHNPRTVLPLSSWTCPMSTSLTVICSVLSNLSRPSKVLQRPDSEREKVYTSRRMRKTSWTDAKFFTSVALIMAKGTAFRGSPGTHVKTLTPAMNMVQSTTPRRGSAWCVICCHVQMPHA